MRCGRRSSPKAALLLTAWATTNQALLAAAMAFARETPRLHINAIEPGFNPTAGLGGGDVSAFVRFVQKFIVPILVPLLMPFIKILSTPKRAAREITKILINASGQTGVYYDEGGRPMRGSALVRDPTFQDRVVAETRAFLAAHSECKALADSPASQAKLLLPAKVDSYGCFG